MTTTTAYSLPDLGYEFDALEPAYSAELLELHYGKHHQAYVDAANQAVEALTLARDNDYLGNINELQRNLAFNVSGHLLHSIFWRNLAPGQDAALPKVLGEEIRKAFGDMDQFREQFVAAGTSIQGSGWAAPQLGTAEPVSRGRADPRSSLQRCSRFVAVTGDGHVGARVLPAVSKRKTSVGEGIPGTSSTGGTSNAA